VLRDRPGQADPLRGRLLRARRGPELARAADPGEARPRGRRRADPPAVRHAPRAEASARADQAPWRRSRARVHPRVRGGRGGGPPAVAPGPGGCRPPACPRPADRHALMEIVLGMYRLRDPGGSEHYTLTAAEQLQRLGHAVTIFTEEAGAMAELARSRGLQLTTCEDDLPAAADVVYAQ